MGRKKVPPDTSSSVITAKAYYRYTLRMTPEQHEWFLQFCESLEIKGQSAILGSLAAINYIKEQLEQHPKWGTAFIIEGENNREIVKAFDLLMLMLSTKKTAKPKRGTK
jgi:hypothetical protein